MSDGNENGGQSAAPEMIGQDERTLLKKRADMLGIGYSPNIGTDTLRQRVNDFLEGKRQAEESEDPEVNALEAGAELENDTTTEAELQGGTKEKKAKTPTLRQYLYDKQMKLLRLRIQNLDPKKKDLHGEIIAVANKHIGTVRKFVPYGEVTEDGFHVPYIIYKALDRRRFLNIRVTKDRRTGKEIVHQGWAKEFSLEVLPPLTQSEINRLATAQAAAGSIEAMGE